MPKLTLSLHLLRTKLSQLPCPARDVSSLRKSVIVCLLFLIVVALNLIILKRQQSCSGPAGITSKSMAIANTLVGLCDKDREKVNHVMNINLDQMINRDWDQIIMSPIETGCAVLKRAGGFYMSGCHVIDGQKQVCLDNYSHGQCLIYSFAHGNEMSFELAMEQLDCVVHLFNPTLTKLDQSSKLTILRELDTGQKHNEGNDAPKTSGTLPIMDILNQDGHANDTIFYMRIEAKGGETEGLPIWIESGVFENVIQLHIRLESNNNEEIVRKYGQSLKALYRKGFRLINYAMDACEVRNSNQPYLHRADLLLQKQDLELEVSPICG